MRGVAQQLSYGVSFRAKDMPRVYAIKRLLLHGQKQAVSPFDYGGVSDLIRSGRLLSPHPPHFILIIAAQPAANVAHHSLRFSS
jgi:hypothetical protein